MKKYLIVSVFLVQAYGGSIIKNSDIGNCQIPDGSKIVNSILSDCDFQGPVDISDSELNSVGLGANSKVTGSLMSFVRFKENAFVENSVFAFKAFSSGCGNEPDCNDLAEGSIIRNSYLAADYNDSRGSKLYIVNSEIGKSDQVRPSRLKDIIPLLRFAHISSNRGITVAVINSKVFWAGNLPMNANARELSLLGLLRLENSIIDVNNDCYIGGGLISNSTLSGGSVMLGSSYPGGNDYNYKVTNSSIKNIHPNIFSGDGMVRLYDYLKVKDPGFINIDNCKTVSMSKTLYLNKNCN